MNFDLIFAIIFYVLIFLFYLKNKNKFEIQGKVFALYKTKLGINLMDKLAKKYPKLLNFLSYLGIIIGFLGMFFILYTLIKGTYNLIFIPKAQPVVAPVLPGISVQGLPVLSFWHWIIAIFIVAVVHEFAHGVYARLHNIKIKSSGFAFLGPILAAFVEPDEKMLKRSSTRKQLSILSAGPFVNIILAFLVILFFNFIFIPLQSNILISDGVKLVQVEQNSPAALAGLTSGIIIREINNVKINSQDILIKEIQKSNENSFIKLATDKGLFYVKPKIVDDKPKIGISVSNNLRIIQGLPQFLLPLISWFNMLFFWLWVINLGVGLFNLLPLGPIDGGRMFYAALLGMTTNKKALNIFKIVTVFCILLILINLSPYIFKLFSWLFNIFS